MRVHRVYLEDLRPENAVVMGREAHHLKNVLRIAAGDTVRVFDGKGGEALGVVLRLEDEAISLKLEPLKASIHEPRLKVTLAVSLLKADKMTDVVRQATELGAARFLPLLSARCDVKTLSATKLARWRRVAKEAAKQSGRGVVPEVGELLNLADLKRGEALGLVAQPEASATLGEVTRERESILVVTGPEGGLSEAEVASLIARGFQPVCLGPRILRAQTAPIAILSALLLPEAI